MRRNPLSSIAVAAGGLVLAAATVLAGVDPAGAATTPTTTVTVPQGHGAGPGAGPDAGTDGDAGPCAGSGGQAGDAGPGHLHARRRHRPTPRRRRP